MASYSAASPVSTTDAPADTTRPLVIVTVLFFMWGLLTSLNDVLIPHLKSIYTLNYTQSMLVQFCFFGAYFLVSLPAGALIRRIGYQRGVVTGLAIAATGCLLFFPAARSGYALFLVAFFVLASGITILQVAANPYVTVLGDPRTASSRLTLTQAFNSLGTTVGPYFGGALILAGAQALTPERIAAMDDSARALYRSTEAATVQGPYLGLAAALALLAVVFAIVRLPRIAHDDTLPGTPSASILRHRHLVLGAVAIFLYVGAEVSIGSLLVNFLGEPRIGSLPAADAAKYVSYYWGLAMVGRFIGFAAMRHVRPGIALGFNAAMSMLLVLTATLGSGTLAMAAIIGVGLFNSIMFPTIFSMALHRLGDLTGKGSGVLCMAIVGGAIVPFLQGALADRVGLQPSFFLPIACYAFILFFGLKYARLYEYAD
ncbi:sugar MFS transporter [Lysobacter claricitrinus]|uniref:sugar MFS transporter n=1 Tax=Lysobacter claricitrinus TaxID=3367728 RepID=UPI0037DA8A71